MRDVDPEELSSAKEADYMKDAPSISEEYRKAYSWAYRAPDAIGVDPTAPYPHAENHGKEETGISPTFRADVRRVFEEAEALLLSKHRDYGAKNISQSPGGALNGLRVRMHDKQARINHLIDTDSAPSNEPLRDSFIDLVNYGIIGLLVLDQRWPNE